MTDKQKARVGIFANWFLATHEDINPYKWGSEVWREWYSTHSMSESIPKEMLPTDAQLRTFDELEDKYIAQQLAEKSEYETLIAFGESVLGKPTEKVVWEVIARTRPCGCKEAQCSFFCQYYGTENCYGNQDNL